MCRGRVLNPFLHARVCICATPYITVAPRVINRSRITAWDACGVGKGRRETAIRGQQEVQCVVGLPCSDCKQHGYKGDAMQKGKGGMMMYIGM